MTRENGTDRPRILIVHPEGNVFNNPNLYEIANFLGERYQVDVLVPIRRYNKGCAFSSKCVQLIEYLPIFGDWRFMCTTEAINEFCAKYLHAEYQLVIGVDRDGLILAAVLSSNLGVMYGMISYEIFFEDETSSAFKGAEREASVDLSFVVVQDEVRGKHLVRENRIRIWVEVQYIPVAPARSYPYRKSRHLRERLNIPDNRKILIYAGSVTGWAYIHELLAHPGALPEDWVLVLHDRYGDTRKQLKNLKVTTLSDNIYISDISSPTNEDMHNLLHSADLGLALYGPNYLSMWTGKNLAFIGMGSGKINVYLQHGLPVVTTPSEVLTPLIQSHGLGYTVGGVDELLPILQQHVSSPEQNQRCVRFFEEHLSFNLYKKRLMDVVEKNVENPKRLLRFLKAGRLLQSVRESLAVEAEIPRWTIGDVFSCIDDHKRTGEKFIVWGENALGLTIQALMPENVLAFVEQTSGHASTEVVGGEVYSSRNLPNMTYDRIIIGALGHETEIEAHLVKELGIPMEKIVRCPG